jgi:hypothetical protein
VWPAVLVVRLNPFCRCDLFADVFTDGGYVSVSTAHPDSNRRPSRTTAHLRADGLDSGLGLVRDTRLARFV